MNGKINLLKYKGARKVSISGKNGIFIPVDENPTIFVSENGAYSNIRIVEKESKFDNREYSHFICTSFSSKKVYEDYEKEYTSEGLREFTPIIGNIEKYTPKAGTEYETIDDKEVDDLPF